MAEKKRKFFPTKEELRNRWQLPKDDTIFFVLQFVFLALQCALFFVCLGDAVNALLPVLYGAVLFLLALYSRKKVCRTLLYVLSALVIAVVLVMVVGFYFAAKDVTGVTSLALTAKERLGFAISYIITVLEPLLLMTAPAFILTARFTKSKSDAALLHILSWILFVLAIGTLYFAYFPTLTGYLLSFNGLGLSFFSAKTLLWIYAVTSFALTVAVYMLYPFGTKYVKRMTEKARAKLPQEE